MANPVAHIRRKILGLSQQELAKRLGVTQATVSRWERAGRFPAEYQPAIRRMAIGSGNGWSDTWFFEVPEAA